MIILFISTFSFLLFLYTASWRYKRDYLHASINIVLFIMFYYCSHDKKNIRLFYTTFLLTKQKSSRFELGLASSLFVAAPLSFIDKYFKTFLKQLYLRRPHILTTEKKALTLVLPFFGELLFQTLTKLQKLLKRALGFCKIQKVFKIQWNLSNFFCFKDLLPYNLVSDLCIGFSVKYQMLPIIVKLTGTWK